MNRNGTGGFRKGRSGNPTGRPKKSDEERRIEEMAREHSEDAIKALVDVAKRGKPDARVRAAVALLDRGWGTPVRREESGTPGAFGSASKEELAKRITERASRLGQNVVVPFDKRSKQDDRK